MQRVLHETCQQYVARRLSEGWRIVSQRGYHLLLSSPDGSILRPVDLRNDIETLRPNAAGDVTELDKSGSGGENWDRVDEETPDDWDTYVHNPDIATTKYDLYGLPNSGVGAGTINSVKVYFRCQGTADEAFARAKIKTGGVEYQGGENTLSSPWTTYSYQWNTNPGNAHTWTWDEIDALQAGVSIRNVDILYARCTQVYVEIDYTTGAAIVEGTGAGSGIGLATSQGKLDIFAQALGNGIGLFLASPYLIIPVSALGNGIGLAEAIGEIIVTGVVEGTGLGSGIGTGIANAWLVIPAQVEASGLGSGQAQPYIIVESSASGSGLGTGQASIIRMVLGLSQGSGVGSGTAEALLKVLAESQGSGQGLGLAEALSIIFAQAQASGIGLGVVSIEIEIEGRWMKLITYPRSYYDMKIYTRRTRR